MYQVNNLPTNCPQLSNSFSLASTLGLMQLLLILFLLHTFSPLFSYFTPFSASTLFSLLHSNQPFEYNEIFLTPFIEAYTKIWEALHPLPQYKTILFYKSICCSFHIFTNYPLSEYYLTSQLFELRWPPW